MANPQKPQPGKAPERTSSERSSIDSLARRSYEQNDQVHPQRHEDPDLQTSPYSRPYGTADDPANNDSAEGGQPATPDTSREQQVSKDKVATRTDPQQTRKIYGGEALPPSKSGPK